MSTPGLDPMFRRNSIYIDGWPMMSDAVFHNTKDDSGEPSQLVHSYDVMAIVAKNMYFGRNLFKSLIDIDHQPIDSYLVERALDIDYIAGGHLVFVNGPVPAQSAVHQSLATVTVLKPIADAQSTWNWNKPDVYITE